MRETTLVQRVIAAVRAKHPGAYVRKIADRFTRGIPDLLVVIPGIARTIFVETKVKGGKGGKVSKIQAVEHELIRLAGGLVIVATSVDEVMAQMPPSAEELLG